MNLKSLSTAEMIQITADWVSPKKPAHTALSALPLVAALVPLVTAAHLGLAATEVDTGRETELRRLSARGLELDREHDALVRCINGTLLALAEGARSSALVARYKSAALALFPEGFRAARGTYKEEAGQAKLADGRLTAADHETLASVVTAEGSLADYAARWKKVAKELGDVDAARARLAAGEASKKGTGPREARNAWIGAVATVVSVLRLAEITEEQRTLILAPLEAETAKAAKRSVLKREAPEPAPAPEPTPA